MAVYGIIAKGDNMKKYLIVLDLDGTLLYDFETIIPETEVFLKNLKKEGHKLVIATGRPFRSTQRFYDQLELDTPLINYNGGLISWPYRDDFTPKSITIDQNDIIQIFEANKAHIYNAFCEIGDDIYLIEKRDDILGLLHYFNGAKLHVGPFKETLKNPPNGCIIVAHKHQGQAVENYIKKHFPNKILARNWGDENRYIMELYTPKTNKGEAIKYVSELLGFNRDQIIAFGDGANDVEMLEYAHIGVAVKNGHPDALKAADIVSPYKHTERPIERFLSHYLNKNSAK